MYQEILVQGVNPDVIVNSAHNQELPEDVEAPKKSQRFVPTWGKGKKKSSGPSAPESTNGGTSLTLHFTSWML